MSKTILAQRERFHMAVEGNEWEQWKARMWNAIAAESLSHPGLVALEQWTWRSSRERRCIDCGEPGTVRQESGLIKAVKHYWFCQPCADYWAAKS